MTQLVWRRLWALWYGWMPDSHYAWDSAQILALALQVSGSVSSAATLTPFTREVQRMFSGTAGVHFQDLQVSTRKDRGTAEERLPSYA